MTAPRVASGLLALGALLMLPACAQSYSTPPARSTPAMSASSSPAPAASQPPQGNDCNAAAAQSFLGQRATPELAERARVLAGARRVRVLAFDQIVTKEFMSDRLNLQLGEDGRISQIYCS